MEKVEVRLCTQRALMHRPPHAVSQGYSSGTKVLVWLERVSDSRIGKIDEAVYCLNHGRKGMASSRLGR